MPSCPFGASLAAARLRDLVLEQGAPLFIVHSFVVVYAGALGCPPALLAPYLQLRDYTISSFNKAHLCSSFTRLLLYAVALGCPPARLAPHLQLRDFTISSFNKAHLCSSFTRFVVVCRCPWVPSGLSRLQYYSRVRYLCTVLSASSKSGIRSSDHRSSDPLSLYIRIS